MSTGTFTNDMFAQIKGALSQSSSAGNSKYKDILKLPVGNVYTIRFIPNMEDPEKTFFHYYTHAWESFSTGQFRSEVSPTTWGNKDPIAEARYSILKHGSDEDKEKASKLIRRENWLANIYVVKDPANPDNTGKVKLLRFGRQIHKIVMEAVEGDDSDEFGPRIFDLSKAGCNLKIKAERQGDFPTYVSSRFAAPSKIAGVDEDKIEEIYQSITDLESVFPVKSYEALQGVLDEHFHCNGSSTGGWNPEKEAPSPTGDRSEDPPQQKQSKDDDVADSLDDDKVKELLAGLGD